MSRSSCHARLQCRLRRPFSHESSSCTCTVTLYDLLPILDFGFRFTKFDIETWFDRKDSADISLATCGVLQHSSDLDSHDTSSISSQCSQSEEVETLFEPEMSPMIRTETSPPPYKAISTPVSTPPPISPGKAWVEQNDLDTLKTVAEIATLDHKRVQVLTKTVDSLREQNDILRTSLSKWQAKADLMARLYAAAIVKTKKRKSLEGVRDRQARDREIGRWCEYFSEEWETEASAIVTALASLDTPTVPPTVPTFEIPQDPMQLDRERARQVIQNLTKQSDQPAHPPGLHSDRVNLLMNDWVEYQGLTDQVDELLVRLLSRVDEDKE